MAFDYAPIQITAADLVADFGRSITLTKFNVTEQDPANPYLGSTNPRLSPLATVTTFGVGVNPLQAERLGITTRDSELIKRSEQIYIIAPGDAFTEDLKTFDEVTDGAEKWKITLVETLRPGDLTLLYYVGVMR